MDLITLFQGLNEAVQIWLLILTSILLYAALQAVTTVVLGTVRRVLRTVRVVCRGWPPCEFEDTVISGYYTMDDVEEAFKRRACIDHSDAAPLSFDRGLQWEACKSELERGQTSY